MGYVFNNPNPADSFVGDCVVRAISIAEDISWNDAYMNLCALGAFMHDMPSSDGGYSRNSYARGRGRNARRDNMGRYSSGYSRGNVDEIKAEIMEKLQELDSAN